MASPVRVSPAVLATRPPDAAERERTARGPSTGRRPDRDRLRPCLSQSRSGEPATSNWKPPKTPERRGRASAMEATTSGRASDAWCAAASSHSSITNTVFGSSSFVPTSYARQPISESTLLLRSNEPRACHVCPEPCRGCQRSRRPCQESTDRARHCRFGARWPTLDCFTARRSKTARGEGAPLRFRHD